jgi:acetyl esterase/lipase
MKPPRLRFALLLALACLPVLAPAQTASTSPASPKPTPYTRTEDVVYGRKFGVALTLDVFQPTTVAPNGYAIIALVSGGWKSSHEGVSPGSYAPYLARGYTVFAVVHGSQPKFILAEIIPDIHRAVRFIRNHSARWSIDPAHIGITGASAGGHLSLTMGTQGGPGSTDAKDPIDRESSAIQAVACFYPPTDFLNYGREGEIAVGVGILKDYVPAFGPEALTPVGRQKLGESLSPARFVTATSAPALIIHGDADPLVPIQQSKLYVARAAAAGAVAQLVTRPGAEHGGKTWTTITADRTLIADWFDHYLRGLPLPQK